MSEFPRYLSKEIEFSSKSSWHSVAHQQFVLRLATADYRNPQSYYSREWGAGGNSTEPAIKPSVCSSKSREKKYEVYKENASEATGQRMTCDDRKISIIQIIPSTPTTTRKGPWIQSRENFLKNTEIKKWLSS